MRVFKSSLIDQQLSEAKLERKLFIKCLITPLGGGRDFRLGHKNILSSPNAFIGDPAT